jgi:DNA-binding response OmpR family regulator
MDNKRFKILVVEDNKVLNNIIVSLLEEAGFSVDAALTYENAKVLLKKKRFDLVTLDWELDGENIGIDLLPFVGEKTKVILVSGMSERWIQQKVGEYEKINGYVLKMNISERLVFLVEEILLDSRISNLEPRI